MAPAATLTYRQVACAEENVDNAIYKLVSNAAVRWAYPKQRGRFVHVDPLQLRQGNVGAPLALQIHHLPARQPIGAHRGTQAAHDLHHALGRHAFGVRGHVLEGGGQQRVARQDGHVLAVEHVVSGLAAAQLVVVHGGQVVMDQAHRVDHLEGHRHGHGRGLVAAKHLAGSQAQDWPNPLPTRH